MTNPYFPTQKPASDKSRADYYREGKRHLLRAPRFPDVTALEALLLFVEREQAPIKAASARRYRHDYLRIAMVLRRRDKIAPAAFDAAMTRIGLALVEIGVSRKPAKATDTTRDEVIAMFNALKHLGLSGKSGWRMAANGAFYAFIVPSIGIRPVELVGAQIIENTLCVQTAKRQGSEPAWRPIPLAGWPADHVPILEMLILMAPQAGTRTDYRRWLGALGEAFARACVRAGVRRIAPYSLRHAALAMWDAAGFTPEEIAALAGHLDLRSARRHYARASVAWRQALAAQITPPPSPDAGFVSQEANQVPSPIPFDVWEDFPQSAPVKPKSSPMDAAQREKHTRRMIAIGDEARLIGERLALRVGSAEEGGGKGPLRPKKGGSP